MSGMGSNGTAGAQAIKAVGGLCIAQDPESAEFPSMPRHLIDAGYADYIARPQDLPDLLLTYAGSAYARGGREANAAEVLQREQQHLREILAVLRTPHTHVHSMPTHTLPGKLCVRVSPEGEGRKQVALLHSDPRYPLALYTVQRFIRRWMLFGEAAETAAHE